VPLAPQEVDAVHVSCAARGPVAPCSALIPLMAIIDRVHLAGLTSPHVAHSPPHSQLDRQAGFVSEVNAYPPPHHCAERAAAIEARDDGEHARLVGCAHCKIVRPGSASGPRLKLK